MLVNITPSELAQALQVMQFVMIGGKVKYGAWLKQVGLAASFFDEVLTPFTIYDCIPKSSVKIVTITLVSPYFTVRNTIPLVLWSIIFE